MGTAVAKKIDHIREWAGVKSREVAQLLDTSAENVSRWNSGRVEPQPDKLNRILELEYVAEKLRDMCAPEEARLWLFSRHRLLQGDTPANRIQKGKIDEVLALIAQIEDGAFV